MSNYWVVGDFEQGKLNSPILQHRFVEPSNRQAQQQQNHSPQRHAQNTQDQVGIHLTFARAFTAVVLADKIPQPLSKMKAS